MGELVLKNLDESVVTKLKQRAERQGLSLEESVRRTLEDVARAERPRPSKEELGAELERIRAMSPPITEPPFAEDLIREDRDGGEDGRYRR
jgi:plasmid stability protein